ncbi:MAG: hypothetical protein IJV04_10305 [Lachnospiraceae bacterium]|nr:hypothetical protein [Lachnospiraceae bacterium]
MSEQTMTKPRRVRVNPSRRTCEEIIRRILSTENEENGGNHHFKNATDFMTYFESLYPSGPALTKQVQRAIRSMNLAKDDKGFFLLGKTKEDAAIEKEIEALLKKEDALVADTTGFGSVLLRTGIQSRSYLAALISEARLFDELVVTTIETTDGLLLLTEDAPALIRALEGMSATREDTER